MSIKTSPFVLLKDVTRRARHPVDDIMVYPSYAVRLLSNSTHLLFVPFDSSGTSCAAQTEREDTAYGSHPLPHNPRSFHLYHDIRGRLLLLLPHLLDERIFVCRGEPLVL